MIKIDALYFQSTISAMVRKIVADVFRYIFGGWGQDGEGGLDCSGYVFIGKGSSEDNKSTVFVILCKCTFDTVDLVGSLEGLYNTRRLHRGDCREDFVLVDGWFYDGTSLVKEV